MIFSMTGYGRAEVLGRGHLIVVEVRSLNGRFLDVHLRLPQGSWSMEPALRRKIQGRFRRGRIEVSIRVEPLTPEAEPQVQVHLGRARAYLRALEKLKTWLGLEGRVDLNMMMVFRDLLTVEEPGLEDEEEAVLEALEKALETLQEMRRVEGEALLRELWERLRWMKAEQQRLLREAPGWMEEHLARWRQRLSRMITAEGMLDPGRLEQEAALWMDRLDVNEELVRLGSHLSQFEAQLELDPGSGKKLEFLLQEMHREVNTFSSKVMNARASHAAVELKAQIERMRELVQNVE